MAGVRGGQHPPRATPGRKGRPCNPTLGFPLAAGTAGDAAGWQLQLCAEPAPRQGALQNISALRDPERAAPWMFPPPILCL